MGGATGGTGNVGDLEKASQTVGRHYLGYRHNCILGNDCLQFGKLLQDGTTAHAKPMNCTMNIRVT